MSSILLSNPFVTPTVPTQPSVADGSASALAVAPARNASASAQNGDATAYSGQGSGYGTSTGQRALMEFARRVPDAAAPDSVVFAQARAAAEASAENIDPIVPFGQNLPDFEMPEIIPTAKWLRDRTPEDA